MIDYEALYWALRKAWVDDKSDMAMFDRLDAVYEDFGVDIRTERGGSQPVMVGNAEQIAQIQAIHLQVRTRENLVA